MSTNIEWTEETWNPTVGCDKVSAGCKHCYAIRMAWRLAHIPAMRELYADTVKMGSNGEPNWTGVVKVSEGAMDKPLRFKKPTMFFVDSMSDLFHAKLSVATIAEVFAIMYLAKWNTYQILTKRANRLEILHTDEFKAEFHKACNRMHDKYIKPLEQELYTYDEVLSEWPLKNVWLGVSVEDQQQADARIPYLLNAPAAVRFLSCEPLLGAINLAIEAPDWDDAGASRIYSLTGRRTDMGRPCYHTNKIDWVIAGGESGPDSRPLYVEWARELRDQCKEDRVPFFFKQWGDWMPMEPSTNAAYYTARLGK